MSDKKNNAKNAVNEIEIILNEKIEKFQKLNTLIEKRDVFQAKKLQLSKAMEDIEKEIQQNNFESSCFILNSYFQ